MSAVQYGEVMVHRLPGFSRFTCTLGVVSHAARRLGGRIRLRAKFGNMHSNLLRYRRDPCFSLDDDDLDPAFDDFRPDTLKPADQFVDHVEE